WNMDFGRAPEIPFLDLVRQRCGFFKRQTVQQLSDFDRHGFGCQEAIGDRTDGRVAPLTVCLRVRDEESDRQGCTDSRFPAFHEGDVQSVMVCSNALDTELPRTVPGGVPGMASPLPSRDTRSNYSRGLAQFMDFAGIPADQPEQRAAVMSRHAAVWCDSRKD